MKTNRLLLIGSIASALVGGAALVHTMRHKYREERQSRPTLEESLREPEPLPETPPHLKSILAESVQESIIEKVKSKEEPIVPYRDEIRRMALSFLSTIPDIETWHTYIGKLAEIAKLDKDSVTVTDKGATVGRFLLPDGTAVRFSINGNQYFLKFETDPYILPDLRFKDHNMSFGFSVGTLAADQGMITRGYANVNFIPSTDIEPGIVGYVYTMEGGSNTTDLHPLMYKNRPPHGLTIGYDFDDLLAFQNRPFWDLTPFSQWFEKLKHVKRQQ